MIVYTLFVLLLTNVKDYAFLGCNFYFSPLYSTNQPLTAPQQEGQRFVKTSPARLFVLILIFLILSLGKLAWLALDRYQQAEFITLVFNAFQQTPSTENTQKLLKDHPKIQSGKPLSPPRTSVSVFSTPPGQNLTLEQSGSCSVHSVEMTSICKREKPEKIARQTIYQWKDKQGRIYFSDEAPKHQVSATIDQKTFTSTNQFTLNLDQQHAALPAFAADYIKRDINSIYRILIKEWSLKQVDPISFNVKLFDDEHQFNAYKARVAPRLGTAGGFYIPRLREASVLTRRQPDRTYAITRHEAVHAINHQAFGRLPTWLNEGLAEYFEDLDFQYGNHAIVNPDPHKLKLLQEASLPSLNDYFSMNTNEWYQEDKKSLHYAMAWSVVYFLLSSSTNKAFLLRLLNQLSTDYCKSINTLAFIAQHYPGGSAVFSQQWQQFLSSSATRHYY